MIHELMILDDDNWSIEAPIIENYCFVSFAVHLSKIFLDVKTYVFSICSTVNHELFSK